MLARIFLPLKVRHIWFTLIPMFNFLITSRLHDIIAKKRLQITSTSLAEDNPLPAHWTGGVHRVFAAQPPEARLAEGVLARKGAERS